MGVEQTVVSSKFVGHICRSRAGRGVDRTYTYGPPIVLIPIGRVAAAYISHGTSVVAFAKKSFAQACTYVKLVRQAAVTNHQTEFFGVLHVADVGGVEVGSAPVAVVTVCCVVGKTHAVA